MVNGQNVVGKNGQPTHISFRITLEDMLDSLLDGRDDYPSTGPKGAVARAIMREAKDLRPTRASAGYGAITVVLPDEQAIKANMPRYLLDWMKHFDKNKMIPEAHFCLTFYSTDEKIGNLTE